ncbi:MAG: hypothetical protein LBI29_03035, partial [Rickettsiales bacterium]|nr:hypothetical protein [Rickettsiales bacterium]
MKNGNSRTFFVLALLSIFSLSTSSSEGTQRNEMAENLVLFSFGVKKIEFSQRFSDIFMLVIEKERKTKLGGKERADVEADIAKITKSFLDLFVEIESKSFIMKAGNFTKHLSKGFDEPYNEFQNLEGKIRSAGSNSDRQWLDSIVGQLTSLVSRFLEFDLRGYKRIYLCCFAINMLINYKDFAKQYFTPPYDYSMLDQTIAFFDGLVPAKFLVVDERDLPWNSEKTEQLRNFMEYFEKKWPTVNQRTRTETGGEETDKAAPTEARELQQAPENQVLGKQLGSIMKKVFKRGNGLEVLNAAADIAFIAMNFSGLLGFVDYEFQRPRDIIIGKKPEEVSELHNELQIWKKRIDLAMPEPDREWLDLTIFQLTGIVVRLLEFNLERRARFCRANKSILVCYKTLLAKMYPKRKQPELLDNMIDFFDRLVPEYLRVGNGELSWNSERIELVKSFIRFLEGQPNIIKAGAGRGANRAVPMKTEERPKIEDEKRMGESASSSAAVSVSSVQALKRSFNPAVRAFGLPVVAWMFEFLIKITDKKAKMRDYSKSLFALAEAFRDVFMRVYYELIIMVDKIPGTKEVDGSVELLTGLGELMGKITPYSSKPSMNELDLVINQLVYIRDALSKFGPELLSDQLCRAVRHIIGEHSVFVGKVSKVDSGNSNPPSAAGKTAKLSNMISRKEQKASSTITIQTHIGSMNVSNLTMDKEMGENVVLSMYAFLHKIIGEKTEDSLEEPLIPGREFVAMLLAISFKYLFIAVSCGTRETNNLLNELQEVKIRTDSDQLVSAVDKSELIFQQVNNIAISLLEFRLLSLEDFSGAAKNTFAAYISFIGIMGLSCIKADQVLNRLLKLYANLELSTTGPLMAVSATIDGSLSEPSILSVQNMEKPVKRKNVHPSASLFAGPADSEDYEPNGAVDSAVGVSEIGSAEARQEYIAFFKNLGIKVEIAQRLVDYSMLMFRILLPKSLVNLGHRMDSTELSVIFQMINDVGGVYRVKFNEATFIDALIKFSSIIGCLLKPTCGGSGYALLRGSEPMVDSYIEFVELLITEFAGMINVPVQLKHALSVLELKSYILKIKDWRYSNGLEETLSKILRVSSS